MLVKVCGMKQNEQILELDKFIGVDFLGIIFYPNSKRFVDHTTSSTIHTKKVGVFVNQELDFILEKIEEHQLDLIQLHGNESVETCQLLSAGIPVIKAFGIDENFSFLELLPYENIVTCFLFDTKTKEHGGSGKTFDWKLLEKYKLKTPFFLSGGINQDLTNELKSFYHEQFIGIDLNSGFEIQPANKDIKKIKQFIKNLSNEKCNALT